MTERSPRTPKRPLAFWTVVALVAALGVGVVVELAVSGSPARPIVVAG